MGCSKKINQNGIKKQQNKAMIFDIESAGSVAQFIKKIHFVDPPNAGTHSA
ncbi:MAG: hypothetical protein NMNS01_24680 [Nitrosomonas sp.]|jgi:hypothetical protein|nr:MAG: hypothetical protein NMNS01_24680 [Nitrosomonas sp.]